MFTTLRQDKNVTQLLVIIFISSIIILFSFPLTHNKEKDVQSLDPLNIEIGVMSATSEDYPKYKHLANVALENINNYCIENRLPYSFEFVYSNGEGMASKALGNLQMYHNSGIDLVVGCGWSSQLCASMSYINENNMVLISPTSTNPQECTRKVDNVFKMSPIDTRYSKSVAVLLEKMGISTIVVLYRGDAWADGIMDTFQREYDGEIVEIRYPGETTGHSFNDYLLQTEKAVQKAITEKGVDEVAVLLLSFREALDILEIVEDYPVLLNVTWFRADGELPSQKVLENVGSIASKLKLVGPIPMLPDSWDYEHVNKTYFDSFEESLGFFDATIYDSCWVLALSVIETGSLENSTICEVLPMIASNFYGITGSCHLDIVGDRDELDMAFWGYLQHGESVEISKYGSFLASNNTIRWNINNHKA